MFKGKVSSEDKIMAVEAYLNGEESIYTIVVRRRRCQHRNIKQFHKSEFDDAVAWGCLFRVIKIVPVLFPRKIFIKKIYCLL